MDIEQALREMVSNRGSINIVNFVDEETDGKFQMRMIFYTQSEMPEEQAAILAANALKKSTWLVKGVYS